MSIRDLCRRNVVTLHRQATVFEAARLMREAHIGNVVVVQTADSRVPVGVVTDRDIVLEVVAKGRPPATVTVEEIMSSPVTTLREEDGFLAALDKMSARGVRRAPVVDGEGHLSGMVSVDDLVPLLARELAKIGALIRHGQAAEPRKTDAPYPDEFAA